MTRPTRADSSAAQSPDSTSGRSARQFHGFGSVESPAFVATMPRKKAGPCLQHFEDEDKGEFKSSRVQEASGLLYLLW